LRKFSRTTQLLPRMSIPTLPGLRHESARFVVDVILKLTVTRKNYQKINSAVQLEADSSQTAIIVRVSCNRNDAEDDGENDGGGQADAGQQNYDLPPTVTLRRDTGSQTELSGEVPMQLPAIDGDLDR
jgi:hypothetical protein